MGAMNELLDRAKRIMVEEYEAGARRVVAAALPLAPERTGEFKDSFEIETKIGPDSVETLVTNTREYAYKIRFSAYTTAEINRIYDELRAEHQYGKANAFLRRHGPGAPEDRLAGKGAFQALIKAPLRKEEVEILHRVQQRLNRGR